MARYCRMAADPNYLWESPVQKNLLMDIVRTINEVGLLIPKFISETEKKLYLFVTDDSRAHGNRHELGFLFYFDTNKIQQASEDMRSNLIKSMLKDGLIKMGYKYDWDEDKINFLFKDIC